jgi:adenylate cyclase
MVLPALWPGRWCTLHLTREAFARLSDLRAVAPIGRVMLKGKGAVEVSCRALGSDLSGSF